MTGWKCKGNSNLTLCFRAQHTLAIFLWNPTSECGCGIIHNFWVGCAEFETYALMRDHVRGVHTTGAGIQKKIPSPVEPCLFDVVRGVLRSTPPCCLSSTFIFDRQAPRETGIFLWICVYKIKEIVVSNFWLVLAKYHFKIKTFI